MPPLFSGNAAYLGGEDWEQGRALLHPIGEAVAAKELARVRHAKYTGRVPASERRLPIGPVAFLPQRGFVVVPVVPAFGLADGTRVRSVVVGRMGGGYRVFANLCRHLAVPLDMRDGNVMNSDLSLLVCRHHGAEFEPNGGMCTMGPCKGLALHRFELDTQNPNNAEVILRAETLESPVTAK